jgi:hypothetical protein
VTRGGTSAERCGLGPVTTWSPLALIVIPALGRGEPVRGSGWRGPRPAAKEYLVLTVTGMVAVPPRLSVTVMLPGSVSERIPAPGGTLKCGRMRTSPGRAERPIVQCWPDAVRAPGRPAEIPIPYGYGPGGRSVQPRPVLFPEPRVSRGLPLVIQVAVRVGTSRTSRHVPAAVLPRRAGAAVSLPGRRAAAQGVPGADGHRAGQRRDGGRPPDRPLGPAAVYCAFRRPRAW